VWTSFFSKYSPAWRVVEHECTPAPNQKTTRGQQEVQESVRGIKKTRQPGELGFNFYSPILNSTRTWRVGE
jgi:hypothetical protein